MDFGYARVSTSHQDITRQIDALIKDGVPEERIYTDKKTGATTKRDGLADLRSRLRPGDRVKATNLDRFGRNVLETLGLVQEWQEQGVGVVTLRDAIPIDTSSSEPMARIPVLMLAMLAEWELIYSRERAAHAREVAGVLGNPRGRKPGLTPEQVEVARKLKDGRWTYEQIAAHLKVGRSTVHRHLSQRAWRGDAE